MVMPLSGVITMKTNIKFGKNMITSWPTTYSLTRASTLERIASDHSNPNFC